MKLTTNTPSPPPTHTQNQNFRAGLRKFEVDFGNWLHQPPPSPPPQLDMGIWDLAELDSASKLEIGFHPPPPNQTWEFGILANLDSASKVGYWFPPHQPPQTHPPTYPPWTMRIWVFSIFGLSIKSWPPTPPPPLPPSPTYPPWTWEFGISAFLDSASKVDCQPPSHPPTHLPHPGHGNREIGSFGN